MSCHPRSNKAPEVYLRNFKIKETFWKTDSLSLDLTLFDTKYYSIQTRMNSTVKEKTEK